MLLMVLATKSSSKSITVPALEETFTGLDDDHIAAEVGILAATGLTMDRAKLDAMLGEAQARNDRSSSREIGKMIRFLEGGESFPQGTAWVGPCVRLVQEFRFLLQAQKWLPAMLRIPTNFQPIITKKADLDDFVGTLTQQLSTLEREWAQLNLMSLNRYSTMMRPLLQGLTVPQLEFLTLLGTEGDRFVEWLLEKDDTDQFNKLMQVACGGPHVPPSCAPHVPLMPLRWPAGVLTMPACSQRWPP